jgi:predicted GIY-YIG superfamily endonuclease
MKYCNNCNKETDRYKAGNCKNCIKSRNSKLIESRKSFRMKDVLYKQINEDKEHFRKESYSKFEISDIIKLHKQNKPNFIYFLTKNDELMYIGKSNGNFLSRINEHIKNKDFDNVYYKSFMSEKIASEQEKQLITKYRPSLNKEYIFNNAKYEIYDLKTEEVIIDTKENLLNKLNASKSGLEGLLHERRNKLYNRYILIKNKPVSSTYKNVLDTHTGIVERHNYITFAPKQPIY